MYVLGQDGSAPGRCKSELLPCYSVNDVLIVDSIMHFIITYSKWKYRIICICVYYLYYILYICVYIYIQLYTYIKAKFNIRILRSISSFRPSSKGGFQVYQRDVSSANQIIRRSQVWGKLPMWSTLQPSLSLQEEFYQHPSPKPRWLNKVTNMYDLMYQHPPMSIWQHFLTTYWPECACVEMYTHVFFIIHTYMYVIYIYIYMHTYI